jgi:hypothetical protein
MDDFLMCVPLISKTTLVAVAETPQSCPGSPSRLKAPTLVCSVTRDRQDCVVTLSPASLLRDGRICDA